VYISRHRTLEYLAEGFGKFGQTWEYNLLGNKVIVISDTEDVKYFLQTNFHNYVKGKQTNVIFRDVSSARIRAYALQKCLCTRACTCTCCISVACIPSHSCVIICILILMSLKIFGDGIFNTDGESWNMQRKTASSLFHFNNMQDFVQVRT